MEELKENISDILYETYRTEKLSLQESKTQSGKDEDAKHQNIISSAKKLAKMHIEVEFDIPYSIRRASLLQKVVKSSDSSDR